MDRAAAENWIRSRVEPAGPIETAHERPWATVLRVPLANGAAWFKACAPIQAFEPRLTSELFARWPDRVPEVLGYDEERAWLLLAGAGTPIGVFGNPRRAWLAALPLYAELQRGEAAHVHEHLTHRRRSFRHVRARAPCRHVRAHLRLGSRSCCGGRSPAPSNRAPNRGPIHAGQPAGRHGATRGGGLVS